MQCPSCRGSISAYNFFREKTCPACGAALKKIPPWSVIKETAISFAEDKGYIFWAIVYFVFIIVLAFFEQIFGTGMLFDYIGGHGIRFLFLSFFFGMVMDYVVRANVEVTAVRNKFIFKPPRYLRRFRNWTNVFGVAGLCLAGYTYYLWPNYIGILPMFTFIFAFMVCTAWAILGIFLTEDDLQDKRIRYWFEEMRIGRIRYLHRASAIYIGGITVAGILYYNLVKISGLWFYIYNSRIVYDTVTFFTQYFGWVKKFAR